TRADYGENRFVALVPMSGRLYAVCTCIRGDEGRIISFRKANKREERAYAKTFDEQGRRGSRADDERHAPIQADRRSRPRHGRGDEGFSSQGWTPESRRAQGPCRVPAGGGHCGEHQDERPRLQRPCRASAARGRVRGEGEGVEDRQGGREKATRYKAGGEARRQQTKSMSCARRRLYRPDAPLILPVHLGPDVLARPQ